MSILFILLIDVKHFFNEKSCYIETYATRPKAAILEHPKLEFHDSNGFCERIFQKALNSQIATSALYAALQNPRIKTYQIIYNPDIFGGQLNRYDHIVQIILGREFYYHTRAAQDEMPKKYLKYFKPDELKKVAGLYPIDAALIHELCHVQHMTENESSFDAASRISSAQNDMDNEEESVTILHGESAYLEELGKPKRVDHRSSLLPGYQTLLERQDLSQYIFRMKLQEAFKHYLVNGLHLDAIMVSEKLTNREIEVALIWIKSEKIVSEYFLEILLAIIEERGLNINFSDPKWFNLLKACLRYILTFDQFEKLDKLGADRDLLVAKRHLYNETLIEQFFKVSIWNWNFIARLTSAFQNSELEELFLKLKNCELDPRYSSNIFKMISFLINERNLDLQLGKTK